MSKFLMFLVIQPRRLRGLLSNRSLCRRHASSSSRNDAFAAHDEAVKRVPPTQTSSRAEHNARQSAVFNEATAAYFASAEATPDDVVPKLRQIAHEVAWGTERPRILDVGVGTGALARYFSENASVVGIDVSSAMIDEAKKNLTSFEELWVGDVVDYPKHWISQETKPFDVAVFNACFGNVFDQKESLQRAAEVVRPGGRVILAHPLGASFVDELHSRDPTVVPGTLPKTLTDMAKLSSLSFLTPAALYNEPDYYLATYDRQPVAPLAKYLLVRGNVHRGYGRGSKKLGFPTANLPEDLFGPTLRDVPAGVYSCFAIVGDEPTTIRSAVANIGYSPTFTGKENPIKIIEAHIIDREDDDATTPDFYDLPLTLFLVAFQRPERKFPNFSALIANIRNDVALATSVLGADPALLALRNHPQFLAAAHHPNGDPSLSAWVDAATGSCDISVVGG